MGRALLRPLIWRQNQRFGSSALTARLKWSVQWFVKVLQESLARKVPMLRQVREKKVILYSDAESTGFVAAVAVTSSGIVFTKGRTPAKVRRLLLHRRTQIVAFELLAAVMALLSLCPQDLEDCAIVHYIDNTPALSCIVKGYSKTKDLNFIVGKLWYEAGRLMSYYRAEYVKSVCNLADGPSRNNLELMEQISAHEAAWNFPSFGERLESWMTETSEPEKLVV